MDTSLGPPVSFWFDGLPDPEKPARSSAQPRAALDVCIIGGGLTGLWTAYYLAKADPSLEIAVLEKHHVGFGASGRNGGWCSALFPRSATSLERQHGFDAAVRMRRAMIATVGEVGRVTALEGIDCDFTQGGTIAFARTPTQLSAARSEVEEARRFGVDAVELWESPGPHDAAIHGVAGAIGASFDPACARLQPAKLVSGLAEVVESMGVRIHEQTEVLNWGP